MVFTPRKKGGRVYSRWLNGNMVMYPGDAGPGDEYFVDSTNGASTNSGEAWEAAMATINQAVDKCTASHGDVIYVAPFHAENLAADSAVDIDGAGISIIGVRYGRQMPTLTGTAIAGDCKLAAANTLIQNLRFIGGVDAMTGIIEVSGADCAILDCEYRATVGQAVDVLTTVDGADRLLIDGYRHMGAAGDGGDTAIMLDGCDDAIIRNFYLYGNFDLGGIECRTTLSARIHIHDGFIWTEGAEDLAILDTITGSTGFAGPNLHIMLKDNAANITEAITAATLQQIDPIYVCNLAGEKALLINTTASTDA